jgi:hypothetical protein
MRGTAGRAALLGMGNSAETKNEMDNRVLFSQEPTNKVVFKHPFMLGCWGGTRGDETLLIDWDALPFVYLLHEGLINHKELGDVVEYSGLSCESLELNTADVILINHRVWTRKQWNGRETLWVLIHVLLPLTGGDTDMMQLITMVGRAIICHGWRVELEVTIILMKVIQGMQHVRGIMATRRGFVFWIKIHKFMSLECDENMLIEVEHGSVRVDMEAMIGVMIT